MKITGELLKAERIKQDIKLSDIAFALKLSIKVIQSIEAGQVESLPSKTFVRGFVKSYAEYLKLDSVSVLKQFQEEMGSTSPVPKSPPPMPINDNQKKPSKEPEPLTAINEKMSSGGLTRNHIVIFVVVTLFTIFFATINHFMNQYSKERIETIVSTSPDQTPSPALGTTDPGSQQSTNVESAVASTVNVNYSDTSADQAAPIENQKNEIEYPSNTPSSGKPVEVVIEAKKDLMLQYAKGESVIFEKIFIKAGSYQVIRSAAGLHLRTEDGSAMALTVNGIIKPIDKSKPLQLAF
jgi:cytoskeletal protein RodZ